jgi:hypothetical protein
MKIYQIRFVSTENHCHPSDEGNMKIYQIRFVSIKNHCHPSDEGNMKVYQIRFVSIENHLTLSGKLSYSPRLMDDNDFL